MLGQESYKKSSLHIDMAVTLQVCFHIKSRSIMTGFT